MQDDKEFKSKIIKFRYDLSESEAYDDDYDEFEDWEVDHDLLEKKDYQGLNFFYDKLRKKSAFSGNIFLLLFNRTNPKHKIRNPKQFPNYQNLNFKNE